MKYIGRQSKSKEAKKYSEKAIKEQRKETKRNPLRARMSDYSYAYFGNIRENDAYA